MSSNSYNPTVVMPLALSTRGLVGKEATNSNDIVIDPLSITSFGFIWSLWHNLTPYVNTNWTNLDASVTTVWTNIDNPVRA